MSAPPDRGRAQQVGRRRDDDDGDGWNGVAQNIPQSRDRQSLPRWEGEVEKLSDFALRDLFLPNIFPTARFWKVPRLRSLRGSDLG